MLPRNRLAALALVLTLVWAGPARAADDEDDDKVVKRVDGALLKELLEEEGYKGVQIKKINDTLTAVTVKMEGKLIFFYCDLKTGSLQGRFVMTGTNANQRKVNKWNESKKFFKAHLDKDGDPVIEHDLVVKHGVTRRTVKMWATLMAPGVKAFVEEVCN